MGGLLCAVLDGQRQSTRQGLRAGFSSAQVAGLFIITRHPFFKGSEIRTSHFLVGFNLIGPTYLVLAQRNPTSPYRRIGEDMSRMLARRFNR